MALGTVAALLARVRGAETSAGAAGSAAVLADGVATAVSAAGPASSV
ncbi:MULTISPECIES: hypothetical protein [unclassified Streptomyces]|nr:hypothetical protein [Streptomyces sp. NBC_00223]